ncbi:hypothetical protein [Nocardia grenadensis]
MAANDHAQTTLDLGEFGDDPARAPRLRPRPAACGSDESKYTGSMRSGASAASFSAASRLLR